MRCGLGNLKRQLKNESSVQLIQSAALFCSNLGGKGIMTRGSSLVGGIESCVLSSYGAAWSSVRTVAACSVGHHPEQDQERGDHLCPSG